jgi:hypothetical protein
MPTFTDDVVVNDANNGTQVVANGTAPGNGGGVRVQKAGTDVGVAAVSGAIKGTSEAHLMVQATSGRKVLLAANGSTTEHMTVHTDGSVGIGTSAPSQKLDVAGHIAVSNNSAHYSRNTAGFLVPVPFVDNTNTMYVGSDNPLGVNSLILGSGQPMIFRVSSAERARLDIFGNLGVGVNVPREKLDVDGGLLVKGPEPWFDVRAFGASPAIPDNAPLIQAAINAVPASGGTVFFPAGQSYPCQTSISLDGKTNIRLLGGRSGEDTSTALNVALPPTLLYKGTGTHFISMKSAFAITMTGITVRYDNVGFTGDLIQCGHAPAADSSYLRFEHCSFSGWGPLEQHGNNARSLIYLDYAILSSITDCWFGYAQVAIFGRDPLHYSNVIQVNRCTFNYQKTASIKNAGDSWSIVSCGFETGFNPSNTSAYTQDLSCTARAFTWIGNWFGDIAGNSASTWVSAKVAGMHFAGNYFENPAGVTTLRLTDSFGAHISGNHLQGGTAIALAGVAMNGISIMGNQFFSVVSAVTNTGIITPNSGAAYGNAGLANQTW